MSWNAIEIQIVIVIELVPRIELCHHLKWFRSFYFDLMRLNTLQPPDRSAVSAVIGFFYIFLQPFDSSISFECTDLNDA